MDVQSKMNFLMQYCLGKPDQIVHYYSLSGTNQAYQKARELSMRGTLKCQINRGVPIIRGVGKTFEFNKGWGQNKQAVGILETA